MFKINKIDHIGIRVKDFDTTVDFYEQFSFKAIRRDLNEKVVVIKHSSGVEINLLNNIINSNCDKNILMDITEKHPGYTHFAINVENVVELAHYITEDLKLTVTEGPVTFGDGKTSIFIRDPDYNVIEFTEVNK